MSVHESVYKTKGKEAAKSLVWRQFTEAMTMILSNGTWVRSEDSVKQVSDWLKTLKERIVKL